MRPSSPLAQAKRSIARGFSLIELMLVVALVGILAAAAVPSMRGRIQASKMHSEVKRVRDTLMRFRDISRTKVVCVELTTTASSITATPYMDCDPLANPLTAVTENFDASLVSLGSFNGGGLVGNLVFQKRGGLDLTGAPSMTVSTSYGLTYPMRVFPVTGFVRIIK